MVSSDNLIKAGTAARLLGVSAQTLRNWEFKDILIPVFKSEKGHRYYSEEQLTKFIKEHENVSQ